MWRCLAVVIMVLVVDAATASADDHAVALDYRGDCEHSELRNRTRELVGHEPFHDRGVPTIRVEVTKGERVSVLVTVGPVGSPSRRIDGASCTESLDAAALVIAMILAQPRAEPAPVRRQRSDAERPPDPGSREVLLEREALPAPPREVELMLGGTVSNRRQLGWSLGAQLRGQRTSLELAFEGRADHEVDLGARRVEVAQRNGSFAPCVRLGRFAACGVLVAGAITGSTTDRTETSPFVALGTRIAWEQPITTTLAIRAQVATQLAVTKTRYWVDEMVVWESPRAELWSGIVMIARFP